MNIIKQSFFALAFCLASLPALASEQIPAHLVGIWATEDAVLKGPYLFEGQALYLDDDGTGAIVGGPPPIGVEIFATYNSETEQVDFDILENGKTLQSGSLAYDASAETISFGPETVLTRRFKDFTDETKRGLGLEVND